LGKEFEVPLIRIGFRSSTVITCIARQHWAYEGAMQMLTTLTNAVLERLDEETRGMGTTDYNTTWCANGRIEDRGARIE